MATAAQIDANRENSCHSTGPITEAGKAAAARKRLTLGLYTQSDYVKPEEQDLYHDFCQTLRAELTPLTLIEEAFVAEITGASWRLRRCASAEATLGDFADATNKSRRSIERARAAAHCALNRSMNHLRKIQTERIVREHLELGSTGDTLAAESRKLIEAANLYRKSASNCQIEERAAKAASAAAQDVPIARNAPCPCNSGEKYKRCCGKNAPPVLGRAA